MATRNRDPPTSLSSSSAKRPSVSDNQIRKFTTAAKPRSAKKRPALADVTNQRNGSKSNSRTSLPSSKPLVQCAAKIAKTKKEVSACTDSTVFPEKTLTASLYLKSSVLVLSKDRCFPGSDQPVASVAAHSAPCSMDALLAAPVLAAPSSTIRAPGGMDVSPSSPVSGSVTLGESMSTCESLKSPEFEYIDNEDTSAVRLIERKTSNSLCISDNEEKAGNVCERGILVEMETFDTFVDIDNNFIEPQCCATIACDIYKHLRIVIYSFLEFLRNKSPSADFMERIQKDINASMRAILIDWLVEVPSMQLECLANYLAELSLLEYSMLRHASSLVAASATFLAKFILLPLKEPWNSTLKHYTLYQASDLSDCVKALRSLCCNCSNPNLPVIREKYSQHKYKFVAKKYCPPSIPLEFFQELSN